MKTLQLISIVWILSLMPVIQVTGASAGNGGKSPNPADQVPTILASVPLPELPATAAGLVSAAKSKDKESVVLAALQFTSGKHPGSISALVGSLVGVLPGSALIIAETAAKLVPAEAVGIDAAAVSAAPSLKAQIDQALAGFLPKPPQTAAGPTAGSDNGRDPSGSNGNSNSNGHSGSNGNSGSNGHDQGDHDGTIRGGRPVIPPGHAKEPDGDRDDFNRRRHYASP
jgi:hypothetical protein